MMLNCSFFNRAACTVAKQLLGKVIRHYYQGHWLAAQIIETESYYIDDKASHASLGFTEKRKALFMPAGSIYMYYARGMDSFNISTRGKGNAVLIKSARYFHDNLCDLNDLQIMHQLNPLPSGQLRPLSRLCSGQAILCRSLHLKVNDWDQKQFDGNRLYIDDINYRPSEIIQTTRLGIPVGRNEELPQRFIDQKFAKQCTQNPLTARKLNSYTILTS